MTAEEEGVLRHVLAMYPVVPAGYHPMTREGDEAEFAEDREMLRELADDHTASNAQRLHRFFYEGPIHREEERVTIELTNEDAHWMLELLNDVRVGNWIQLGSPDEKEELVEELDGDSAHRLWAMEMAGLFQSLLLNALMDGE